MEGYCKARKGMTGKGSGEGEGKREVDVLLASQGGEGIRRLVLLLDLFFKRVFVLIVHFRYCFRASLGFPFAFSRHRGDAWHPIAQTAAAVGRKY